MSEAYKRGDIFHRGEAFVHPVPGLVNRADITMREHFAGLAMQGILVNAAADDHDEAFARLRARVAEQAVLMADALIAELAKERT